MISLFYEISLHLLAIAALPKFFFHLLKKGKYRTSFLKRFGKDFPFPNSQIKRPLIWVHAVSLGETRAVSTLIRELKKRYPCSTILLSTTTETGFAEGNKSIPEAEIHAFLPFDFRYIIRPIVRILKPELVIFVETDFWLNFQKAAKDCGAKIIVVNAKLSEKSRKRFQKIPSFSKQLFETIDHLYLQNPLYFERFKSIGVSSKKLTVTGNLKLDHQETVFTEIEKEELRSRLGIKEDSFVLTLGSTHNPEEKLFIQTLKDFWKRYPSLKVLIVPRHPERFNEVAELLEKEGISYYRYSSEKLNEKAQCVLIDAMGMLRKCYQLSHLAFVGGTFTEKVGGHNMLEPSFYGIPVITGPYLFSQPDFSAIMQQYNCGLILQADQLKTKLNHLINSPSERFEMGQNGKKAIQELGGAVQRTLENISIFFTEITCCK